MRTVLIRIGLAMFVSLSTSFSMSADDKFCSVTRSLVDAAPTDFARLRGDSIEGVPDQWASRVVLPNASECSIIWGKNTSFYCRWQTDTPKTGIEEYRALAAGLETCFPDAKVVRDDPDKDHPYQDAQEGITVTTLRGTPDHSVTFNVNWDRTLKEIDVYLSKDK